LLLAGLITVVGGGYSSLPFSFAAIFATIFCSRQRLIRPVVGEQRRAGRPQPLGQVRFGHVQLKQNFWEFKLIKNTLQTNNSKIQKNF
jgi:hypothetical protein